MLEIFDMPGHLIRRMNQVSVSIFTEEISKAGFDITPVQYAALIAIRTKPTLDQATLANLIAYDRVTIGGVVDRLVKKEMVRREFSKEDRRARELYLTKKGEKTLKELTPVVHQIQILLLEGLEPSERETFNFLLNKIINTSQQRIKEPLRKT